MPFHWKLILYFAASFVVCYVMNQLLMGFSQSLGIRNKNDITIRWNKTSKPSLGGIAIFMTIIFFTFIYLATHTNGNIFGNPEILLFFLGLCLAFLMGLSDDAFNTRPLIKLSTQIICGYLLVLGGHVIQLTGYYFVDCAMTIIWTVGIMNSINMLDNMDAIASSITLTFLAFILGILFIFTNYDNSYWPYFIVSLAAATLAFLWLNKPPSRLFMGDSGSQLIGFTIAFLSIKFIWELNTFSEVLPLWIKFFLAMNLLGIPFIDTFTVVYNRIRKGRSPAIGGKDHTTHHLSYAGYSEKKIWILYWVLSIMLGLSGFLLIGLYLNGFQYYSIFAMLPFYLTFYFLYKKTVDFEIKVP